MLYKTNRTFKDVETNEIFALWSDSDTHEMRLFIEDESKERAKGTEVNGFYICTFTDCHIKINADKVIHLPQGTFYNMKQGERITHKKFKGKNKFSKV